MPEAFAVVAVFVIAIAVCVIAWFKSRDKSGIDPRAELERLQHHELWLKQRLEVAQKENWGADMVAAISADLAETAKQITEANAVVAALKARAA